MIPIFLMYFFLALSIIASRDLLATYNPLLIVTIRMFFSSIVLGGYAFFINKSVFPSWRFKTLMPFFILGFFNVYIANAAQVSGLEYIDPLHASLWYNCTPFIVALLDFIWYREAISCRKMSALMLGWLGFVPLIIGNWSGTSQAYFYGAGLFLIAAFSMALGGLMLQKNKQLGHYDINLINGISMAFGGMCALMHYGFIARNMTPSAAFSLANLIMLAIACVSTAICATLYAFFVQKYDALAVTFAGFSLPLFSIFIELIIGNQVSITVPLIISAGMITIALVLFCKKEDF